VHALLEEGSRRQSHARSARIRQGLSELALRASPRARSMAIARRNLIAVFA
jgi:hypothetical protein